MPKGKNRAKSIDSFAYRLQYAMLQKGFRNCDLCHQARLMNAKLSSSMVSQYLNGIYEPKQDKIVLLGRILGVPELWLMGVTPLEDIRGTSLKEYSNPQEAALLANFRRLNKEGKELALRLIGTIADTKEYKQNELG